MEAEVVEAEAEAEVVEAEVCYLLTDLSRNIILTIDIGGGC